jgi:hypothetical protein
MLRFMTNQQTQAHNLPRAAFDRREAEIAANNAGALIGNAAPIGLDAWRRIDARGAMIQRDVLNVFNRLARANQTPVDIADIVSFYPKVSDSGSTQVTMDGRAMGRGDQATVTFAGTPVPIIHSEASFGWRQWAVLARSGGFGAADSLANNQRSVAEKLEDIAINGMSSIVVGGNTIYGLKSFPDRNSGTYGAFDLNGTTGANWVTAFRTVLAALIADNSFGQATVFVNYADWFYAGTTDYVNGSNVTQGTIQQRILSLMGVREVIPCSKLAANDIIAINNIDSGEWGSVLNGMAPTTRPKARVNQEDDYNFTVMASAVPQFRSDSNSRSHIAAYTRT